MKLVLAVIVALSLLGCTTTTTTETMSSQKPADKPTGFFDRLMDQITERECRVARFTCPYGLGPAGEPCDCTDPSGRVWQGKTIK
jgi:hypothetical protein